MRATVLALDLERTLVSDALRGTPRPGLLDYLTFCHGQFERVALFTTVEEADARSVLDDLDRAGYLPAGFLDRLEYVAWHGEHKALEFVSNAAPGEVLLIDDDAGWIRPDQRDRWIPIAPWDGGPDAELTRVRAVLERCLVLPSG